MGEPTATGKKPSPTGEWLSWFVGLAFVSILAFVSGWTQSAIRHFTLPKSGFHVDVDQADFQSWTAHPTDMLPEQEPGTLLNVAYQYLLPETSLTMAYAGGSNNQVQADLTAAGQTV
jgi:hypothetical protein